MSEEKTGLDTKSRRFRTPFPTVVNLLSFALVDMLNDEDFYVQSTARELLFNLMRDDPGLFLRVYMREIHGGNLMVLMEMITRLKRALSSRKGLPVMLSHMLTNYCIGYMNMLNEKPNKTRQDMVTMRTVSALVADAVSFSSGLSFKDFKKFKLEPLLVTTGSFWFVGSNNSPLLPSELLATDKVEAGQLL